MKINIPKVLLTSSLTVFFSLCFGATLYIFLALTFPKEHYYVPITNFEIYGLCVVASLCAITTGFLIGRYTAGIKLN
ncbi:MAG: hypothetical protein L3J07_01330 [Candidatus Magasanikbacteria bacterium]|nr:hypothetical protein [Candidatus Magasanikbacteria bacterium]